MWLELHGRDARLTSVVLCFVLFEKENDPAKYVFNIPPNAWNEVSLI